MQSVYSGSLILPDSVLEDCIFLGIYLFHPVCGHIIVHNIFLQSFVFLWCQLLILLFHYWFYVFEPFLFFSWWVWLKCVSLVDLFKEPALGFIDLLYHFLDFISFISALIFIVSFLLLTLGSVCCSFSNSFKCEVRLFIWDFPCFFREACNSMNSKIFKNNMKISLFIMEEFIILY